MGKGERTEGWPKREKEGNNFFFLLLSTLEKKGRREIP